MPRGISESRTSRRAQRQIAEQQARKRRQFIRLAGAMSLAIALVVVMVVVTRPESNGETADRAITLPPARDGQVTQDGRTLGSPDAPVTIVEYADFQCPACGQFALDLEPRFIQDYIVTGKVRLVYHDFPFLDDREQSKESDLASIAAFAAQEQGRFWDFHDVLYANQDGENNGAFIRERLIVMAERLGLDVEQFTASLDNERYADEVQALYDESLAQGIPSTPTFDINGQKVIGADYQAIERAIEAALGGS